MSYKKDRYFFVAYRFFVNGFGDNFGDLSMTVSEGKFPNRAILTKEIESGIRKDGAVKGVNNRTSIDVTITSILELTKSDFENWSDNRQDSE